MGEAVEFNFRAGWGPNFRRSCPDMLVLSFCAASVITAFVALELAVLSNHGLDAEISHWFPSGNAFIILRLILRVCTVFRG